MALGARPTFAGLYIDRQANDVVDVATTGAVDEYNAALATYASQLVRFRVRTVTYSLTELKTVQSKIESDFKSLCAADVPIVAVGVDVVANRVRITLTRLDSAQATSLQSTYGPRIELVQGEEPHFATCVSRQNCGSPIKGGIEIQDAYGTICTSGFISRDISYAGAAYVLTAGHCININGLGVTWLHNGSSIGSASSEFYSNGSNVDAGYITLSTTASPGNQVFASSTSDIRSISSWNLNSQQTVGSTICRSGRTSGYTCGSVDQTDQTVYVSGILIYHMWRTSFASAGGDSGGSMIYGNAGLGVLSATTSSNSYYSTLEWIYDTTGKTICTSSGC